MTVYESSLRPGGDLGPYSSGMARSRLFGSRPWRTATGETLRPSLPAVSRAVELVDAVKALLMERTGTR